ncbi:MULTISPECIES: ABC transporter permease [unclassified Luteococcus]|uniref:ABC transporter permease n=1 Tax=unclassified Luteococcus TaxID=2639923 RepID=UPI00313F29E9
MSADTTTATPTPTSPANTAPVARFSPRRLAGLARSELIQLLRNKVSVFYAVAMGPLMVLMLAELPMIKTLADVMPRGGLATMLTTTLAVTGLGLVIYYNLTTAVVARRETLVLKRLRSGCSSVLEILTALALPNVLIFWLQVALVLAVVSALFGAPSFTNPLLLVLGLGLGAVFFAIASFLTGVSTRTVESAQLTTMPGIMLFLGLSGLLIPLSVFPDAGQRVIQWLPVAPVAELVMLGLNGTTLDKQTHTFAGSWQAAAQPVAALLGWILLAGWYLNRTMRWEPRR